MNINHKSLIVVSITQLIKRGHLTKGFLHRVFQKRGYIVHNTVIDHHKTDSIPMCQVRGCTFCARSGNDPELIP